MFKIEINVNGVIHHRHWRNKHEDDFLQFLPKHFTRELGELITPEMITAYLIDETEANLLDGKNDQSEINDIYYVDGKILVKRIEKAIYKVGDKVKLEEYEEMGLKRDGKFKDSKEKKDKKTKKPKTKKEDLAVGKDENGDDIIEVKVDVVTVEATDDLANDIESVELELTGTKLKQWPYDKNGKFLGNK